MVGAALSGSGKRDVQKCSSVGKGSDLKNIGEPQMRQMPQNPRMFPTLLS
jgi:hypothetical protein